MEIADTFMGQRRVISPWRRSVSFAAILTLRDARSLYKSAQTSVIGRFLPCIGDRFRQQCTFSGDLLARTRRYVTRVFERKHPIIPPTKDRFFVMQSGVSLKPVYTTGGTRPLATEHNRAAPGQTKDPHLPCDVEIAANDQLDSSFAQTFRKPCA